MGRHIEIYRELELTTSNRLELLIKLYQGAIDFMSTAKMAIEQNSPSKRNWGIAKAKAIVIELQSTLDFQASAELCRNLYLLYDFVLDRLNLAGKTHSTKALDEAIKVMEILKSGWEELALKLGSQIGENPKSQFALRT